MDLVQHWRSRGLFDPHLPGHHCHSIDASQSRFGDWDLLHQSFYKLDVYPGRGECCRLDVSKHPPMQYQLLFRSQQHVMALPFQSHCWQCAQQLHDRRGDFCQNWAQGAEDEGRDEQNAIPQFQASKGLEVDELLCALRRRRASNATGRLLLVKDTVCYRRLAKSVTKADAVLEIGSSLGECTYRLTARAAAAIGIEVSEELVEESRRRHPTCRFEWLDCFQEQDRLRDYCWELKRHGHLKIFVDIGGDRTSQDTPTALTRGLQLAPVLLVVKCEHLVADVAPCCDLRGVLQRQPVLRHVDVAVPSAGQVKKKLARAKRAQWQQANGETWESFEKTQDLWDALTEDDRKEMKLQMKIMKAENPQAWGESFEKLLAALVEKKRTSQFWILVTDTACYGGFTYCILLLCLAGGTCLVEVAVRSADMFLVKSGWSLPVEHTGPSGDYTTYYGDPFRCCNDDEGRVPSCCDLVSGGVEQRTAETFCDAWGSQGKVDYAGKPCNFGSWPCLFDVVPGGPTGDMIGELMYFVEPDVSSYVAVVIGLSVILLLLILAPWLMKNCRCDCNLNLLQEEEDAELYDPDDPASDWGQAVQEALQEEYQRKLEGGCCAKLAAYVPHREKLKFLSRVTRVLCALCRRKKTDQVSEASPEGERSSRRSASKISQGRESRSQRGSKTVPEVSEKTPVEAEPLGVSRQSQSVRQSQAESLGVSRQSQSLRQSQAEPLGVSRQSQSLRQSQARQVLIETEEEEKAPPPIVPVSLPPGFIYDEISDVEGVKKYQKWDSLDKEATDFTETDIHPGFQLGNLSSVARVAQQQRQSLFMPIVEPIPRASAKAYTTNTLHYCSSSFRESRRKKRPERSKNIKKRPGGAHEGPGKLNWAQDVGGPTGFMQQNQMFRNLHGKGNHRPSTSPTMLE
eukprot:symbB.v1.2.023124.t2/scaffold2096.1/size89696/3